MSRLVLLQTPVHAASEIKRIMRSVRDNEISVADLLLYHDIDPDTPAPLLDYGGVFEDLLDAARSWEAEHTQGRDRWRAGVVKRESWIPLLLG